MRVIHFVPSAFEYFEDIRSSVFQIVEELDKLGVESEIITLQYGAGAPSKSVQKAAAEQEMKRSYKGVVPNSDLLQNLTGFDIIHFHVPCLGFVGKFLKWHKLHSKVRIVMSYYRPIPITDGISWFIRWYNKYYLPKLAKIARGIVYFSERDLRPIILKVPTNSLSFNALSYANTASEEKTESFSLNRPEEVGAGIVALYMKLLYTKFEF